MTVYIRKIQSSCVWPRDEQTKHGTCGDRFGERQRDTQTTRGESDSLLSKLWKVSARDLIHAGGDRRLWRSMVAYVSRQDTWWWHHTERCHAQRVKINNVMLGLSKVNPFASIRSHFLERQQSVNYVRNQKDSHLCSTYPLMRRLTNWGSTSAAGNYSLHMRGEGRAMYNFFLKKTYENTMSR